MTEPVRPVVRRRGIRTFCLSTMLLTLAAACAPHGRIAVEPAGAAPVEPIPFSRVDMPWGFKLPSSVKIIGTSAQWRHLWSLYATETAGTEPPSVDFRREVVVAVSYGPANATCSDAGQFVWAVERLRDTVTVHVGRVDAAVAALRERDYAEWMRQIPPVCDSLGHPVHVVRFQRTGLPVRIVPTHPSEPLPESRPAP